MPTDQGIGFDDGESGPPVEQTRQSGQREANGVGGQSWFYFSLHKKAELFTQK